MFDPAIVEPAVDFLVELAGGGRALEFGIGTGRVALPLARRAWRSTGSSGPRRWSRGCARSRAAKEIGVTIGDSATTRVDGSFSLVYLIYNTIGNLTIQEAGRMLPQRGGAPPTGRPFVIEVLVPELRRLPPGDTFRVFERVRTTGGSTSTTSRRRVYLASLRARR